MTDVQRSKPEIDFPEGEAPAELVVEEIVEGDGAEATAGDVIAAHYVGVAFSTGEQFDASWDRGTPLQFQLGVGQVIAGWDQGMQGMRVGGRRKLTIPAHLAYGDQGAGGVIAPGETLIFVVDLLAVAGR
ncbi:FKBP-type peptidyl-prolyl cis-trans isomerase [Kytococcus sp. Marseille-QA3725]